jgi:ferredoxin
MRRTSVIVDLSRCEVYAQCIFAAPEVFRLRGEDSLEFDPRPDEARREQILRAARACPVQAIKVGWVEEEDEPGLEG